MKSRTVLKTKPYSDNPADAYLEIVLCEVTWGSHPYVTWVHNKSCGGYYYGNYFETLHEANTDFDNRGRRQARLGG